MSAQRRGRPGVRARESVGVGDGEPRRQKSEATAGRTDLCCRQTNFLRWESVSRLAGLVARGGVVQLSKARRSRSRGLEGTLRVGEGEFTTPGLKRALPTGTRGTAVHVLVTYE